MSYNDKLNWLLRDYVAYETSFVFGTYKSKNVLRIRTKTKDGYTATFIIKPKPINNEVKNRKNST